MLQITRAAAAFAARKLVFQIVVIGSNGAEGFDRRGTQRRASEIGVDQNAGPVDERLNARRTQFVQRPANLGHDRRELGNLLFRAQRRQFPSNDGDHRWPRHSGLADGLQDLLDRRNGAQIWLFHLWT